LNRWEDFALGFGSLASLTGFARYDKLMLVSSSWCLFVTSSPVRFERWQDAWVVFHVEVRRGRKNPPRLDLLNLAYAGIHPPFESAESFQ
jgi:hypothetical protein